LRLNEARELERKHRVPAGRLVHAQQRWAAEADGNPRAQEVPQRTGAQRPELELYDTIDAECLHEIERIALVSGLTQRHQHPDRERADSSNSECDHPPRGRIEPLHIVDRHQHRSACCERVQSGDDRARKRHVVRSVPGRSLDPERDRQSTSLRLRKLAGDIAESRIEKIGQTTKRDRHLGFDGTSRQHHDPGRLGSLHGVAPEHRLADAGLPADKRCARDPRHLLDKTPQPVDFTLAPDELNHPDPTTYGHNA